MTHESQTSICASYYLRRPDHVDDLGVAQVRAIPLESHYQITAVDDRKPAFHYLPGHAISDKGAYAIVDAPAREYHLRLVPQLGAMSQE